MQLKNWLPIQEEKCLKNLDSFQSCAVLSIAKKNATSKLTIVSSVLFV